MVKNLKSGTRGPYFRKSLWLQVLPLMNTGPESGQIVSGKLFNEPMRIENAVEVGDGTWRVGVVGMQSERFRSVTLTSDDFSSLTVLQTTRNFNRESFAAGSLIPCSLCPLLGSRRSIPRLMRPAETSPNLDASKSPSHLSFPPAKVRRSCQSRR